MKAIGLDIGTTSVCAVTLDANTGQVLRTITRPNNSAVKGTQPFERLQDPNKILEIVTEILSECDTENCAAIGVTGQMHGILYVDHSGEAKSPLYTWQDSRGDQPYKDGKTYAQYLTEKYNCMMAAGFGLTTHFYNVENGLAPSTNICTIADYIAMKISNSTKLVMHPTIAESCGYDYAKVLPEVCEDYHIVGKRGDIPVSVAIGDNQASFIGSVRNMSDTVLINIGTGGQISALSEHRSSVVESRPCVDGKFLMVGASLCGGRAFALLENFFREIAQQVTGQNVKSAYAAMDRLLDVNLDNKLLFDNKFCGTRENPALRASVTNLSIDNFTMRHFMLGVLEGIVSELYEFYEKMNFKAKTLAAAGNGIRKNKVLQEIFCAKFGLPMEIPAHTEEAAFGAALFALVAAGRYEKLADAQQLIMAESENI